MLPKSTYCNAGRYFHNKTPDINKHLVNIYYILIQSDVEAPSTLSIYVQTNWQQDNSSYLYR